MSDGALGSNGQSARAGVMEEARAIAGDMPVPALRSIVCPYCGTITPDSGRCSACSGRFDPLSRQATQNQMGPWSIRDDRLPFRPGCTYETITRLIDQRKISPETILRGPSTRQFWTLARHTPGVAHLLGMCHSCQSPVKPDGFACPNCHASFSTERDRQHLGLGPFRPLPGQGLPEVLALHAEPASQPSLGGVQSLGPVISTQIGSQSSPGNMGQTGADSIELSQQVEESARLARRWKMAWESQRRQAWIVIFVSITITLIAMIYAILGGNQALKTKPAGASSQIPAQFDE